MNPSERYHLAAPLPAVGGWRRTLALDRRPGSPGPIVLAFAPAALLEDAGRLAALVRDVEAAGRIVHPNVLPVTGLETVDDQLALVEPYCPGTTLRAVLDAAGRMPPDLAVRAAVDACAGLGAVHAVDSGDHQPLAHGALTAERLLVTEAGAVRVCGVGTGGGRSPGEDIRALAAVLYEALSGEPPASPVQPLDAPGVPAALALVVDGALDGEGAFPSAAAFAAALVAAVPPAPAEGLAAYAEAVRPTAGASPAVASPAAPEGPAPMPPPSTRAAPAVAPSPAVPAPPSPPPMAAPARDPASDPLEVSAELVRPSPWEARDVEPTGPVAPPPDAAITFPAPELVATGRGRRVGLVGGLLVVGFAAGFALARMRSPAGEERPQRAAAAAAAAPSPSGAEPTEAARTPQATPPPAPPPATASAAPSPGRAEPSARPAVSLAVTASPAGEVLVDGKRSGRAPVTVQVAAGEHEVRLSDPAQGIDVRRRVVARGPATPVRFELVRGELQVSAPDDAEIWLDGRRIGTGNATVRIWEGPHRVEARRGSAKVQKRFEVTALQTQWTFDVTPTP